MKAILIAAGMGRRLSPYTDDRPKCLVEIAGRTMLHRQLDNLRAVGVTEFHIVRGYRGHQLSEALAGEPNVHFIENPDYQRNNILLSLMYAADRMDGGFFCSYSDIVYRPEVAAALAQSRHELGLVVDPFWADAYAGRDAHPISEAELAAVRTDGEAAGRVTRVGKKAVPIEAAHGEFIGLWRASASAAVKLRELFQQRWQELGPDAPYGRAPRLQVAYLTDLLNDLIEQDFPIHSVDIARPASWREIDTVQDFERAADVVTW
jgi:choline kinase